jgi:hypothetical protein
MQQHLSEDVNNAIKELQYAICQWERSTGRRSLLILKEEGGFNLRLDSGNPIPEDIPDEVLLSQYC